MLKEEMGQQEHLIQEELVEELLEELMDIMETKMEAQEEMQMMRTHLNIMEAEPEILEANLVHTEEKKEKMEQEEQ